VSKKIDKYIPIIVFVLFVSVISILTKGRNINFTNIKHILNQSVALIISGMGVIFVMSQGSLDLTQGSILVLAPLIGIFSENAIPGSFIPVVILVGMLIGLMTGSIFSLLKVPSFVATLCLSFVLRTSLIFYGIIFLEGMFTFHLTFLCWINRNIKFLFLFLLC